MRTRIKDYKVVKIDSDSAYLYVNRPNNYLIDNVAEAIRLVINETQKVPITHSMGKDVVTAVVDFTATTELPFNTKITLASTGAFADHTTTDKYTVEVDWGTSAEDIIDAFGDIDIDTSDLAKEATLGTTADSSVATTIFGWLKVVWDKLVDIVTTYPYAKEATLTDATNGLAAIKAAVQGITIPTDYAKQGSDSTATNTALLNVLNSISTNMYKGVPVQTQTTNATIAPNIWNVWESVAGNLTITKGTDIVNIVNEYMVRFKLASNWSGQITFSGFTLDWNGGSVPTWTAGNTYEISIVNNIALWAEIEPAS